MSGILGPNSLFGVIKSMKFQESSIDELIRHASALLGLSSDSDYRQIRRIAATDEVIDERDHRWNSSRVRPMSFRRRCRWCRLENFDAPVTGPHRPLKQAALTSVPARPMPLRWPLKPSTAWN